MNENDTITPRNSEQCAPCDAVKKNAPSIILINYCALNDKQYALNVWIVETSSMEWKAKAPPMNTKQYVLRTTRQCALKICQSDAPFDNQLPKSMFRSRGGGVFTFRIW